MVGKWDVTANGYTERSFWGGENVLKFIVVIAAQLCGYKEH